MIKIQKSTIFSILTFNFLPSITIEHILVKDISLSGNSYKEELKFNVHTFRLLLLVHSRES